MTDIVDPPPPAPEVAPALTRRAEAVAMLRLAGPVIVARAGLVIMLTVDTFMTGLAGAGEIAKLGLGLSPVMVFMLATVGLLQGSMVLIAQANGGAKTGTPPSSPPDHGDSDELLRSLGM